MQLAISIPVHENNAVVANLVENILHYNPGCVIVLHVSAVFQDFDPSVANTQPGVFINPHRYSTQLGKGLMLCHCSNFRHLVMTGRSFDAYCLMSSNEMFVRNGLNKYVEDVQNGFQAVPFEAAGDWHLNFRRIDKHPKILALLSALATNGVFGGQAEGQFFQKPVFQRICDIYLSVFGEVPLNDFETEEVVPQTIAMALGLSPALPFTLVDYSHNIDFRISIPALALLANPALAGRVNLNIGLKSPLTLVSPHAGAKNTSVFSVKRVPRLLDDPLRVYINNLSTSEASPVGLGGLAQSASANGADVLLIPDMRWRPLQRALRPSSWQWLRTIRWHLRLRTRFRAGLSFLRALLPW
jgi:hypothetical protein